MIICILHLQYEASTHKSPIRKEIKDNTNYLFFVYFI